MEIRIGSVKAGDAGEYIGRANSGRPASPLANPFPLTKQQSRTQVLQKYRTWLYGRLRTEDKPVIAELVRLLRLAHSPEGVTLVCWCRGVDEDSPACHGDIIKAALEWMAEDEVLLSAVCELGGVPISIV
jgi:hypothetical protein